VIDDMSEPLGFEPRVLVDGPLDTGLDDATVADAVAALREALTNVAKHAHASQVDVAVIVGNDTVTITVTDDGVGPPTRKGAAPAGGGHGIDNLTARAARHSGTCELRPGNDRGSVLTWTIPRR
jgi:signal transduction histidine kinase